MAPPIDYTLPLDELPDPLPIAPLTRPFDVTITPPGSKSITNRAYVLAALAKGESRIIRPLRSDDTDGLLSALCTLGAKAKWVPGETGDGSEDVLITGVGGRFPRGGIVNLGDGGTPTRFMIACACLAAAPVVVDGSKRMRERPIAEGVEMLRQLGADIEYIEQEGRLPVRVTPSENFRGGELTVGKTASSQFVSAVMLIASCLERGVTLHLGNEPTSGAYVALTCRVMSDWGNPVLNQFIQVSPSARCLPECLRLKEAPIEGRRYTVEPDASSAIYFLLMGALHTGSEVFIPINPYSGQPDLEAMAHLRIPGSVLGSIQLGLEKAHELAAANDVVDASFFPDGAMTIAIASALGYGPHTLTGLHTLRVKETDRIAALANELRKVGCTVETTEDSITIHPIPAERLRSMEARRRDACATDPFATEDPIIIETYSDHRMAMAFAVLGLRVPGIQIRNPACVRKSYPGFWQDFARLYGEASGTGH